MLIDLLLLALMLGLSILGAAATLLAVGRLGLLLLRYTFLLHLRRALKRLRLRRLQYTGTEDVGTVWEEPANCVDASAVTYATNEHVSPFALLPAIVVLPDGRVVTGEELAAQPSTNVAAGAENAGAWGKFDFAGIEQLPR